MLLRELHLIFVNKDLQGSHLRTEDFLDMLLACDKLATNQVLNSLSKEDLIDLCILMTKEFKRKNLIDRL